MARNRNASPSAFGWEFQVDVAIYLLIKYFGKFEKIKSEGEKEDIEISLDDNTIIYVQVKAKQDANINDESICNSKLRKALDSLSDVNDNNAKYLIYVSNLEPNPLNSGTDEFHKVTFLKYNELSKASKNKIDNQLNNINKKINKDKLIIARIPFFGEDKINKQKFIIEEIESFFSIIDSELLQYKYRFMEMMESDVLNNSSQKVQKIKKEEVLWKLLLLKLENNNINNFDETLGVDEEIYYDAIEKYRSIIEYKEGKFEVYNKISQLIEKEHQKDINIRSTQFVNKNEEELYDIVFDNSKNLSMEIVERVCSKIIAKRIFIRKSNIKTMFERANEYEDT